MEPRTKIKAAAAATRPAYRPKCMEEAWRRDSAGNWDF
jgi:hypothetical protein